MSTVPPVGPAGDTVAPPPDPAPVPVYDRREPGRVGRGLVIGLAVAALLIGGVGGFLVGRSTASTGPSSLADAIRMASQSKLPRGDITGTVQRLGGLRGLFGGGGRAGGGGGVPGGAGGNGGGGRGLVGTVTSVASDVVTVDTPAGPVEVRVTPSTTITKNAPGRVSDLADGVRILVRADLSASGGSGQVTARSVQELPPGGAAGAAGAGT